MYLIPPVFHLISQYVSLKCDEKEERVYSNNDDGRTGKFVHSLLFEYPIIRCCIVSLKEGRECAPPSNSEESLA
jgi:hypothetical protein